MLEMSCVLGNAPTAGEQISVVGLTAGLAVVIVIVVVIAAVNTVVIVIVLRR